MLIMIIITTKIIIMVPLEERGTSSRYPTIRQLLTDDGDDGGG
jgi:hypothetical protein